MCERKFTYLLAYLLYRNIILSVAEALQNRQDCYIYISLFAIRQPNTHIKHKQTDRQTDRQRKKYEQRYKLFSVLSVLSFLFILLLYYLLYATSRGE